MKFINEANSDRIGRVVLGIGLLYLSWSGTVDGGLGTALQIIGFVQLITGLVGWCPIYAIFGLRTNSADREAVSAA
jgi:hypothetical protein